ncbi:hypothetical protein K505DRAFT_137639 [Melanomma pulvis-pyrius CBS 109.77]|uniref:Transmembrane protein n=1 Tax=Melanomma pulvis-pyrius CBS 109.77 TaxID=1314802 RepID=A0A6A6WSS2_9PLEO|nr:hypothetical protein K505DRAFT_137639 [Melanomma pulvis-pyrius CBS 109.77]
MNKRTNGFWFSLAWSWVLVPWFFIYCKWVVCGLGGMVAGWLDGWGNLGEGVESDTVLGMDKVVAKRTVGLLFAPVDSVLVGRCEGGMGDIEDGGGREGVWFAVSHLSCCCFLGMFDYGSVALFFGMYGCFCFSGCCIHVDEVSGNSDFVSNVRS